MVPIGLLNNTGYCALNPIQDSSKDLAEITELAQDQEFWRGLTARIEKAAEVSQTKNWDVKRQ